MPSRILESDKYHCRVHRRQDTASGNARSALGNMLQGRKLSVHTLLLSTGHWRGDESEGWPMQGWLFASISLSIRVYFGASEVNYQGSCEDKLHDRLME